MAGQANIGSHQDAGKAISNSFVQKLESELPQGPWYQVNGGIDSTIYPDFFPASGSGAYYPGFQLANSYVGYNAENRKGLAYLATVATDPVQSKETNGVVVQGTGGLDQVVRGLYSNLTYGLTSDDQRVVANGKTLLQPMAEFVSKYLETKMEKSGELEAYQALNDESPFDEPFATTSVDKVIDWVIDQGVKHKNLWKGGMARVWDQHFGADGELIRDEETQRRFTTTATRHFREGFTDLGGGIKANMKLGSYGPTKEVNGYLGYAFKNPWSKELYDIYRDNSTVLPNGKTVIGINNPDVQHYNSVQREQEFQIWDLRYAKDYLRDFKIINRDDDDSAVAEQRIRNRYKQIVEGIDTAPDYALPFNVTPRSSDSGTNISFGLQTSGSHTTSRGKVNSLDVEWKANSKYKSGWGFGGSISNTGSKSTRREWGTFDSSAKNLSVTETWEGITTKAITPSKEWFRPEIINQAWTNKTADDPDFTGGWAFKSPDAMSQYVTGSLYYIDGIAYAAKYKGEIKGDTSLSSKAFEDQYDHFKQTTEASAGFSWGDFSIGGSSKFSTEEQSRNRTDKASSENGKFTITHDPLGKAKALFKNGQTYTGDPKSLIAISLKMIGEATSVIKPSSSARKERARELDCYDTTLFMKADPGSKSTKEKQFRINGSIIFFGGENSDKREYIKGDDRDQIIYGLDGDEKISAGGGNDKIWPGSGISKVRGGEGADLLVFRREDYAKDEIGNFTYVKDWNLKEGDRLAFNGVLKDQVFIHPDRSGDVFLWLDGIAVARFINIDTSDLQTMVNEAYFSVTAAV